MTFKSINFFVWLCMLVIVANGCSSEMKEQASSNNRNKPNIVFIYADDLGYGDLGCYGAEHLETPYLDRMAEKGAMFENFYSCSPVCSPSRAGFLTGRYPVRQGITRVFFPNSLQGIDSSEITLPEILRDEGYQTGIIGKWHLGHLPEFLPMNHGFDYWFGLPYSNDMEWKPRNDPPLPLYRNSDVIAQPVHQKTLTQRYTCEAVNFIARNQDNPFFLYMAHTFPHTPLHVSTEYNNTSPTLYGDVVQELDRNVGEIIKALEYYGLDDNTLVVFSSDNGPAYMPDASEDIGSGRTGGLRGWKATTFEGGVKVPTLAYWPGRIKAGKVIDKRGIMMDWFVTMAHLGGADLPDERPVDGIDIGDLLWGNSSQIPPRAFFFYRHEKLAAAIVDGWKLKLAFEGDRKFSAHGDLLFNLDEDPNETTNLIEEYPDKAGFLKSKIDSFIHSMGNIPPPKTKAIPFDDPREKE
ncbi:MAG: sulfatase [Prolixibacteraceae bacterium]|nr:sulfatase [Prolixibacteraceae bacterium]